MVQRAPLLQRELLQRATGWCHLELQRMQLFGTSF